MKFTRFRLEHLPYRPRLTSAATYGRTARREVAPSERQWRARLHVKRSAVRVASFDYLARKRRGDALGVLSSIPSIRASRAVVPFARKFDSRARLRVARHRRQRAARGRRLGRASASDHDADGRQEAVVGESAAVCASAAASGA